jgi:hypothetical protein
MILRLPVPVDLTILTESPPVHTHSKPLKMETYTLTSVIGAGCVGTASGTGDITVIIPPVVDIEANATYCDGDPIADLTVVSANGGTVNWYDNPSLTPPLLGTGNTYTPSNTIGSTTYYAANRKVY